MKSLYTQFIIGLALTFAFLSAFAKESMKKPNIIFILADDLGRHQMGLWQYFL
jgi:hypothetical protein